MIRSDWLIFASRAKKVIIEFQKNRFAAASALVYVSRREFVWELVIWMYARRWSKTILLNLTLIPFEFKLAILDFYKTHTIRLFRVLVNLPLIYFKEGLQLFLIIDSEHVEKPKISQIHYRQKSSVTFPFDWTIVFFPCSL